MFIAGADEMLRRDGYELRRTGPLRWAYVDLHDESGREIVAGDGDSPANAARDVLGKRYGGVQP